MKTQFTKRCLKLLLGGCFIVAVAVTVVNTTLPPPIIYQGLPVAKTTNNRDSLNYAETNTLNVLVAEMGSRFNPIEASTDGELFVVDLLFQPLFYLDKNLELYPSLATSITTHLDKLVHTITIDTSIKFSDGSYLTIEDVKNSLVQYILKNKDTNKNLSGVQSITAASKDVGAISIVDDTTLQIAFEYLDLKNSILTDALIYKSYDDTFVGTGSYTVNTSSVESVLLTRNSTSAGYSLLPKTIELVKYQADITIEQAIAENNINFVHFTGESAAFSNIYNNSFFDIYSVPNSTLIGLIANPNSDLGNNLYIRQLVESAMDREKLVAGEFTSKKYLPTNNLFDTAFLDFGSLKIPDYIASDAYYNMATQYLNTDRITMNVGIIADNEVYKEIGVNLKEQLNKAGISVNVISLEPADYLKALYMEGTVCDFLLGEVNLLDSLESLDSFTKQYMSTGSPNITKLLELYLITNTEDVAIEIRDSFYENLMAYSLFIPIGRSQTFVGTSLLEDTISLKLNGYPLQRLVTGE